MSEIEDRQAKLNTLRQMGINPFGTPKFYHKIRSIFSTYGSYSAEELAEEPVLEEAGGRVIFLRDFGKLTFAKIRDRSGIIQIAFKRDVLSEEQHKLSKLIDVGDYIEAQGNLFRTQKGELTIQVSDFQFLSKSIRPLPEKHAGLTDLETRSRQRYLDLIANEDSINRFLVRSKLIDAFRNYLTQTFDFVEVETPMMHPIPGGANARPFVTHHNALDTDFFLRIAPELYLKRLIIGGMERVFEINRSFRNEGMDATHNPEFTMLEFYEAYATFESGMEIVEDLLDLAFRLTQPRPGNIENYDSCTVPYQGQLIHFGKSNLRLASIPRIRLADAIAMHTGSERNNLWQTNYLLQILENNNVALNLEKLKSQYITEEALAGKLQAEIMDELVEPKIIDPAFITHYPVSVSPLARRNDQDPSVTDRFELIIAGKEIANGFSELNDHEDQRKRFEQQAATRAGGDDEGMFMDEDFLVAMEHGMPPCAGVGVGIDRLVMLFTDTANIRDVILFPQMRKA